MKATSSYRQQVTRTLTRLKAPGSLEAAIAASKRLRGKLHSSAKPVIDVDEDALQRVQEGQDSLHRVAEALTATAGQ